MIPQRLLKQFSGHIQEVDVFSEDPALHLCNGDFGLQHALLHLEKFEWIGPFDSLKDFEGRFRVAGRLSSQ